MFKSVRALHLGSLVLLFLVMVLTTSVINAQRPAASTTEPPANDANPLKALQWRSIGPFRGGRVDAVAGVATQPMVYYFGGTGGGVWKTTDGGINWEPVSDGSVFGTGSVGAIGLSDSDRIRSMWAWASRPFAATFHMAMECINRRTRAKRGNESALKTHGRSRAFACTRKTRRWCM